MRGHEEASGTKYVPSELIAEWATKDPIKNFEDYLIAQNVFKNKTPQELRNETKEHIESELAIAFNAPAIKPETEEELNSVYAPLLNTGEAQTTGYEELINPTKQPRELRFIDAIKEALKQSMEQYPEMVLMGQDIAEYGGAFKITEGFVELFGKARVRNTPICESAIVGAALGLSLEGIKSVMEMQFADFASVGFNQIVNNLAKIYYRWGQNADVVIRMPTGGGVGAGPFHSQSNEAWFVHTPGLKVVYPSTPADAKGLLIAAIKDPNPVMFFEHKALYRKISGSVPEEYYEIEIGKARQVQTGEDISIITYGAAVHWAVEYAKENPSTSFDILDLRTLLPLDYNAIKESVARTGKVLLLHEDTLIGGIGGEISAWINEYCFKSLDAPVVRCASLDTPVPFNSALEENFLAKSRIDESVKKLLLY
jgi:2-oxoisovalerate dehydrogenase E1 component